MAGEHGQSKVYVSANQQHGELYQSKDPTEQYGDVEDEVRVYSIR
jgi:hypothetical protein